MKPSTPKVGDAAMTHGAVVVAVLFLIVALTCGGSSSNPLSAGIVRVCAIPVLALGLWGLARRPAPRGALWPLLILAAAIALVVAQSIPMPSDLWRNLPGHQRVVDAYQAAGMALPWLPASLTPQSTWDALLGFIPPTAMFCLLLTFDLGGRRTMAAAAAAVGLVSVALGILQLAGGPTSPLRIYAITNPESGVGFFANRNHQAGFLATTLPLAGYLAARWAGRGGGRAVFWLAAGGAFALVIVVGALATGSRAGAVLCLVGGVGAIAVAARTRSRSPGGGWRFAGLAAPAVVAVLGAGLIAIATNPGLAHAFQGRFGADLRFSLIPRVVNAGLAFAPFGSGAGSFGLVYQMFEPVGAMGPAFVNHAHDDFLEIWMEAGWAGLILVAAFLAWWVVASWKAMSDPRAPGAGLSLAGSIVVGLLLAHSLVDYPLRTPALATLFALACGLIGPVAHRASGASSARTR